MTHFERRYRHPSNRRGSPKRRPARDERRPHPTPQHRRTGRTLEMHLTDTQTHTYAVEPVCRMRGRTCAGRRLATSRRNRLVVLFAGIWRLYKKFQTPWAPAIAIAIFAAMFSLSAFVIGPAITGDSPPAKDPATPSQTPTADHSQHHG